MTRINLQELPNYKFNYNTTIKSSDLNYAGHLGNEALVGIIQDARIELFKDLGFKELDLGDGKSGIIIGDLVVNFKAEGFINDELKIESQIGEITDKSFRIFHKIVKVKDNNLLALAETGVVAFNYKTREVIKIPPGFLKTLENLKLKN